MPTTTPGITQGGLTVLLAGVDITQYVQEDSIDISDTLAQGAGSGSGASGRASTFSFITTLGPAATAYGGGVHPSTPTLIRNGEVQIYDMFGSPIFGGYATKVTDQSVYTRIYTKVEGHDYWQELDRIIVNEVYSGKSDVFIINDLLSKYAPWVDRSLIPTFSSVNFSVRSFRNMSLQKALQGILDVTGYAAWVDASKVFHYTQPLQASTAPFSLSNEPDFRTSFQSGVESFELDDNAAINRVYFYGGKQVSNDFTQDLSTQNNGNNKTFVLAYYPRKAADGSIHVTVNGVEKVVGFAPGTTPGNTFKSAGGLADVLVNADAHTLTFDVAPASGATVLCKYRYELPLVVVVTSEASRQFYGRYLDATISDDSVVDPSIAVQRARVLLLEQAYGLATLKMLCWRAGLQSGMILPVYHSVRNIDASFLIQEVHTTAVGAGLFQYELTLGAWNWTLVDVVKKLLDAVTPQDTSTDETTTIVSAQTASDTLHSTFTLTTSIRNYGGYYARASALADGHDAYCGFTSITS